MVCVGSHKLKLDGKNIEVMDIGMCKIPDALLETCQKLSVDMEEGGV